VASVLRFGLVHLGLDGHKATIAVGSWVLTSRFAMLSGSPTTNRSVVGSSVGVAGPGRVRACYAAGPAGLELVGLLHRLGVRG
jgi:hypothetical protein